MAAESAVVLPFWRSALHRTGQVLAMPWRDGLCAVRVRPWQTRFDGYDLADTEVRPPSHEAVVVRGGSASGSPPRLEGSKAAVVVCVAACRDRRIRAGRAGRRRPDWPLQTADHQSVGELRSLDPLRLMNTPGYIVARPARRNPWSRRTPPLIVAGPGAGGLRR